MGVLLRFPDRTGGTFTPAMRHSLARLAAVAPDVCPMEFAMDDGGTEVCRLANNLVIGWDRMRRLFVSDTSSGFVDRGPFSSMDEVCRLIEGLRTWGA